MREVAPDNRSGITKLLKGTGKVLGVALLGAIGVAATVAAAGGAAMGLGHLAHRFDLAGKLPTFLGGGAGGALETGTRTLSFAGQNFSNFVQNGFSREGLAPIYDYRTDSFHQGGTFIPSADNTMTRQ